MAYTVELLKREIAKNGGDSNVLAFIFNNAYSKVFRDVAFNSKTMLNETDGVLTFSELNELRYPYTTTKLVEYIEGITYKHQDYDREDYDPRFIRG